MTDREKMTKLADILGDFYIEKPQSIIFTEWQKRFKFNNRGEIIKIQSVTKDKTGRLYYTTLA